MKIDKIKRSISDISLIKKGMTLNGGIVDDITIEQMYQLSKDGIPVFLEHVEDPANRSPADAVAYLTGIYKDEDGLRGHIQFLKAFAENRKAEYETLMERAEIDASSFGISMSWFGKNEKKDGKEHYRASIVASGDLVSIPAGVDNGLLSADPEKLSEQPVITTVVEEQKQEPLKEEKYMKLSKETYEKIKAEYPQHLDKAIQLSFSDEVMDVYEEIQKIVEAAKIEGLYAENSMLKSKVAELEGIIAQMKIDGESAVKAVEESKQELSLKLQKYEDKIQKLGFRPIEFGENVGEKKTLKQQMEDIKDFAQKLSFYRKHQAEIDSE